MYPLSFIVTILKVTEGVKKIGLKRSKKVWSEWIKRGGDVEIFSILASGYVLGWL